MAVGHAAGDLYGREPHSTGISTADHNGLELIPIYPGDVCCFVSSVTFHSGTRPSEEESFWHFHPSIRNQFDAAVPATSVGRKLTLSCLPILANDSGGDTNCQAAGGYIFQYHRIGTDIHIVADSDVPQDLCPGTDVDIVAERRGAFLVDILQTDGHSVADDAIVTKTRKTTDDDAAEMVDTEISPDGHLARQFDAGDNLHHLVQDLVEQRGFVIETGVPQLRRLPPGDTIIPFDVSANHLGFDEHIDLVEQISVSHHYFIDGQRARTSSAAFRYDWPSELDLMAEMAGMKLEHRWSDWRRSPFTGESRSHISVWRLAGRPPVTRGV